MGVSGRIARFFASSQLTPLIALVALLLGVFAVLVTPREEEPQINVTMVNVFVPFPGASVKDVEGLVTTPAEQVLSQITGVEHIYSVTRPGSAVLTVQFKVGEDRTAALVRLHDTLQANRDWVSPWLGVGEPIIKPKGIDDVPIVTLTLWTRDPARAAFELSRVAHAVETELKRVRGSKEIYTLGGPDHVLAVRLDPDRLSAHNIAPGDVRAALELANVSQPAGMVTRDNSEYLVQTGAFLANVEEVRRLVVGVNDGQPVFIADVAQVTEGADLPTRYVWHGLGAANASGGSGEFPAVTIAVTKQAGENASSVARDVIERVNLLKGTVLPEGIEVTVTRNYGETASDKAMQLIKKLVFATASVIVLVWVALGWREAVIVGIAVGLTLAATLFASWAWGFTLNRVSLFALIFSIGILVDDAIVVVENIHRQHAMNGEALSETIPLAVDEVGGPTILATFTVIAALLPMAFVSGLMGPYMGPIPINASMGMVISLAVAFVVTPWLAQRLLAHAAHHDAGAGNTWLEHLFDRVLTPFLRGRVGGRARLFLALAVTGMIGLVLLLPAARWVVLKMLPFDNKSEFQVVVDMPTGTPVERTAALLHELGMHVAAVPEVTHYQAYAGTASPISFNGLVRQYYLRAGGEYGDLQVNLLAKHLRHRKSHDIAAAVRPGVEAIARRYNADVKVVEVPPGPPVMSPIVAEVYGPDYDAQMRVAKRMRETFARTPDIVGIDDSIDDAAPRMIVRVVHSKAALYGINAREVVQTMQMGLDGSDVTPLLTGQAKYEVPVRLSLAPERKFSLDDLLKLTLRTRAGALVPLSELVTVQPATREKAIYHKDMLPVVYVVGDMVGKLDSPLYGMFGMRGELVNQSLPEGGRLTEYFIRQPIDPYRSFTLKWDGEWQITYETFRDMGIAYAVGLVLIYVLIVAEFKSYLTPLIIMAPIPLTIIGVMPGHALLGAQFTATSMIGMIALAGIIVRNSILLVDFIEAERQRGTPLERAVVLAGSARMKPIVLTGLAAMLGAFFILDDPIFSGLAVSLIFGVAVSTLLTLTVIPVLYYAINYEHPPAASLEAGVSSN